MNDKVKCEVCGKFFKAISTTHLKSHGMTFSDYRKIFPDAPFKSDITINKISGKNNTNYGKPIGYGRHLSDKHKINIGIGVRKAFDNPIIKKRHYENTPRGENAYWFGKHLYDDTLIKISATKQGILVEEWENFKGNEHTKLWGSKEYEVWRITIFRRDNYTCQECGQIGGELEAHHILPWRDYPDIKYSLNIKNGITLCKKCHRPLLNHEYEYFNKYFDIANNIGGSIDGI